MSREPPIYRPFALVALGATVLAGSPLGAWMLARLYWGGGPFPVEHVWLHAHLQTVGFFGTLIVGVAHHLIPRFANRPVARTALVPWLATALAGALVLRLAGVAGGAPLAAAGAAAVQAAAFAAFGVWVWRGLGTPPGRPMRPPLVLATLWLALAMAVEAVLRVAAAGGPDPSAGPEAGGVRAVHAMALLGGVLGWITGVLTRAAPMLVPGWSPPGRLVASAPWLLATGVAVAAAGAAGPWPGDWRVAVERAGEAIAVGTLAALALLGGALRRPRGALPMLARRGPETWFFRLTVVSAAVAALGSAAAAGLAWAGVPLSLLADALRHLVTVGVLTAMTVGMAFRLVPVLEVAPLRWPRLRLLAFWTLLAGVVLRTAEVLADYGFEQILHVVPLAGGLVWVALAALSVALLGTIRGAPPDDPPPSGRAMTAVIGPRAGPR